MKWIILIFMLFISTNVQAFQAKFLRALDGDTILIEDIDDNMQYTINLACIDAPEISQPYGISSRDYLASIVDQNINVKITYGDMYGRLIAVVENHDKTIVNEKILTSGNGWLYPKTCPESMVLNYLKLQEIAKTRKLGLWKNEESIPPWEWRHRGK